MTGRSGRERTRGLVVGCLGDDFGCKIDPWYLAVMFGFWQSV